MWLSTIPMTASHFTRSRPSWGDGKWVHQRVMALFGDLGGGATARASGGVLYRVESSVGRGRVLVQSAVKPQVLQELNTIPLEGFLEGLQEDALVRFSTRLNSVRTVNRTVEGRLVKKRHAIPEEEVADWVRDKMAAAGIDVVELSSLATSKEAFGDVPLNVVDVSGVGKVSDVVLLRNTIKTGIGRGKAYGCGMLSVLPVG